jgi:hypothetical protein
MKLRFTPRAVQDLADIAGLSVNKSSSGASRPRRHP